MATTEAQPYIDTLNELKEERRLALDETLMDVSEYLCPSRGRFEGDDSAPDRMHGWRGSKIIDSTPVQTHYTATNGMHSGLTPAARPWVQLVFQDDDLMKYGPAKDWLSVLTTRVYTVLRRSNFYSAIRNVYAEILAYSNAAMFMQRDFKSGMRFRPFTFGECWWSCDYTGRVDTLYRSTWMTARQMIQKWGEGNVSNTVKSVADTSRHKSFQVIHAVQPRKNYDPKREDKLNKPYESVYFECAGEGDLLSKGGFENFPYIVGRWDVIGNDAYGTDSPGVQCLSDIKELQATRKNFVIAQHKEVDPPVMAPSSMAGTIIRTHPGGITWYDSSNPEGLKRLYEQRFDIANAIASIQDIRERIRHGFFADVFMMIQALEEQRGSVTATQVMEMKAEKLEQLGPFVQRAEDEILDPVIEETIAAIMDDPVRFELPEPPEEIMGQPYKIEYIGVLAQAQKQVGKTAIDDMTSYVANVAQIDPSAWDVFDVDEAIRSRGDMLGLPPKVIRGQDEVLQIRQVKQQQMEQQQAMMEAQAMAEGGKTLSDTKLNPQDPNVLTEMLKGMGTETVQ